MPAAHEHTRDFRFLPRRRCQTLISELWDFLEHNKKWWLLPILLVVLLLGMLVFLGGSGAAPFVYTLFQRRWPPESI